jgi:hypothetical protein
VRRDDRDAKPLASQVLVRDALAFGDELAAETASLPARIDREETEISLLSRDAEVGARNDLAHAHGQHEPGARRREQLCDLRFVGAIAVKEMRLVGPARRVAVAGIGGVHELHDRGNVRGNGAPEKGFKHAQRSDATLCRDVATEIALHILAHACPIASPTARARSIRASWISSCTAS